MDWLATFWVILEFLMGLNESFFPIPAQILLMEPLPLLSKVFALVIQEERQRSINTCVPFWQSFPAHEVSSLGKAIMGTFRPRRFRPSCTYCSRLGHNIDMYYKVHGYPPRFHSRFDVSRKLSKGSFYRGHANQVSAISAPIDSISIDPNASSSLTS